jgi:hypothetical protein
MLYRFLCLLIGVSFFSCEKEEVKEESHPFLVFKPGAAYTSDGASVPLGGEMHFGITGSGDGYPITYFRVTRTTDEGVISEVDKGIYITSGGMDTNMTFFRSGSATETWSFFIMNENRDTAVITLTINLGSGSAWGNVKHFTNIRLSYPNNSLYPHYLDLDDGTAWADSNVAGHEADVDMAVTFYISSSMDSPTLCCPGYTNAVAHYPLFGTWSVKNMTNYDYKAADNLTITEAAFDGIVNDSLLINGYGPAFVSGWCKFCTSGKIIPFKNADGKYGMIKVVHADVTENGYMEVEVKIQD